MFLPSFIGSVIGNFKRPVAVANDVTPGAVNWTDASYDGFSYNYTTQQITGISTSITLQVSFSNTSYSQLYYKINATNTVPGSGTPPYSASYTSILHNGTITVANNEWLAFGARERVTGSASTTVTVINQSDSNTTLDTFTSSSTVPPP